MSAPRGAGRLSAETKEAKSETSAPKPHHKDHKHMSSHKSLPWQHAAKTLDSAKEDVMRVQQTTWLNKLTNTIPLCEHWKPSSRAAWHVLLGLKWRVGR